jgi:hypothetical protein
VGEELNRHRAVRMYPLIEFAATWDACVRPWFTIDLSGASRSVRAYAPEEKNWADRSIDRSGCHEKKRETDRPMCALDWAFLQGWLGSLHANKVVSVYSFYHTVINFTG